LPALRDYAEPLRGDLKQLGFPEVLKDKGRCPIADKGKGSLVPVVIGWLIGISILATFVLGVVKILEILYWLKKR
jgi:hypothetical protein